MNHVKDWFHLPLSRSEVEIATVLACGQSFRWKNGVEGRDPNEWIGVFSNRIWILKQTDESIFYQVVETPKLSQEEYNNLLYKYFQLNISLPDLYKQWSKVDSKFENLTIKDYQGIRMLEQDPIENIFSFICSSNNNIIRISQMVEKLCRFYGKPIGELDGKIYYDFPQVEKLIGSGVEQKLRGEMFGYRAAYITNSAQKIVENGGREWVESLKNLSYDEARTELQTLPGIGRKVADCVCLMSLGFPIAIPVDTHMHAIGKQYLPHLSKIKTLTDKVYTEIAEFFQKLYGPYAGWAHSVLFASTLRHLKSDSGKASDKKNTVQKRKNCDESASIQVDEAPADETRPTVKSTKKLNGAVEKTSAKISNSFKNMKSENTNTKRPRRQKMNNNF